MYVEGLLCYSVALLFPPVVMLLYYSSTAAPLSEALCFKYWAILFLLCVLLLLCGWVLLRLGCWDLYITLQLGQLLEQAASV